MENVLNISCRKDFRAWLKNNCYNATECWVEVKRGRPKDDDKFYYIDAVEEALCFGWIDSVWKNVDGIMLSKFSPRQKNSHWTELNKERVRRLEKLGLMTDAGRKVLPAMGPRSFKIDDDVKAQLKANRCWQKFRSFPDLYQRIRAYNVAFYKTRDKKTYNTALENLIVNTKQGKMYGQWNDYGRLL